MKHIIFFFAFVLISFNVYAQKGLITAPQVVENALEMGTKASLTEGVISSAGGGYSLAEGISAAATQTPIATATQIGVLSHLELPIHPIVIPASSPSAISLSQRIRWAKNDVGVFFRELAQYSFADYKFDTPAILRAAHQAAETPYRKARIIKKVLSHPLEDPKKQFLEHIPEYAFGKGADIFPHFSPDVLQRIRNWYISYLKEIEAKDFFASDDEFSEGIKTLLVASYTGGEELLQEAMRIAKQAPQGRRFFTDFAVTRVFLKNKDYKHLQELMNFRQEQEEWMENGQFLHPGETGSVYKEIKLYSEKAKKIPVVFPQNMPAEKDFEFIPKEEPIVKKIISNSHIGWHFFVLYYKGHCPPDSPEGLVSFLES